MSVDMVSQMATLTRLLLYFENYPASLNASSSLSLSFLVPSSRHSSVRVSQSVRLDRPTAAEITRIFVL